MNNQNPAEEITCLRLRLLSNFYRNQLCQDGDLLANGWHIRSSKEQSTYHFARTLGGSGTPFVSFDLSIIRKGTNWIPMHGDVEMNPVETTGQAANLLMDYWRILHLRDRLTQENYRSLCADVGEWVGRHYGRNFEAESAAKREEWVDRYCEAHGFTERSLLIQSHADLEKQEIPTPEDDRYSSMADAQREHVRNSGMRLYDDGISDEDREASIEASKLRREREKNPLLEDGSNDIDF